MAVVAVVALVVVSVATFGAGAVIGAALIGAALGAACNVGGTIASDIKNNKMSSPLDYLISAAKGALVGALCGAIFGPAMAGTSLFAAETTGQLALNFAKTLFIGGAENSTYYALNELANFRMPNLGEQLNQFKNGVLFTGLFTGGAKALETAVPWIKKGASKVMDNIEKNVNKFGKYIDDLVPARAVTPDGQTVYIKNDPIKSGGGGKKVELNKQQKEYNKAVEESKNGKGDKGVSKANADALMAEKKAIANKAAKDYNAKYNPVERGRSKGYEGIGTTANGGATFEGTQYMYPVGERQLNRVTIAAQGKRPADFNLANEMAGLESTPSNAVWHHLDDYNVETGEITLELVYKDAHRATVPHAGSCAQYDAVNGQSYNK
ncbi:HNH endonuclease [Clostridium estertheticum]|uniref:HNH endonuclease n=3 Tax=Clostridium estertheticum TaxID=238834 RepID=UPI00227B6AE3|nr:HNH endonuclease [Clostridium estertheticum]WAG45268.1 HNH endonuclease [Clostridium estertheticum]